MTGINYRCGQYGFLPQGFVESSYYPERALDNIPNFIDRQREQIVRFEKELPTLKEIVSHQWSKTVELDELKKECADLQRRIDERLKSVEKVETSEQPEPNMPEIAA